MAYQTNESGCVQVAVQPCPDADGTCQVSTAGGATPITPILSWQPPAIQQRRPVARLS